MLMSPPENASSPEPAFSDFKDHQRDPLCNHCGGKMACFGCVIKHEMAFHGGKQPHISLKSAMPLTDRGIFPAAVEHRPALWAFKFPRRVERI